MTQDFYVIAPISLDLHYEDKKNILLVLAKSFGFRAYFPLDRFEGTSSALDVLPDRIAKDFQSARFVLADLSYERPSCYYELGIAQASEVSTVLIAEAGTDIHQAGGRQAVRYYADLREYQDVVESVLRRFT
jgi:hypothetical protein